MDCVNIQIWHLHAIGCGQNPRGTRNSDMRASSLGTTKTNFHERCLTASSRSQNADRPFCVLISSLPFPATPGIDLVFFWPSQRQRSGDFVLDFESDGMLFRSQLAFKA
eukprot:11045214-Karenia_brevis.AAC.1